MPSFQEEERMGMALGLTLVAVGAILNLAVSVRARWIDVPMVGSILFVVGLLTFGVYLWLAVLRRRPYRPRAVEQPRYREEYAEDDGYPDRGYAADRRYGEPEWTDPDRTQVMQRPHRP